MKRIQIFKAVGLCCCAILCISCHSSNQRDAFTPGQFWYDDEQQLINAHGGGILYQDGTYYWFGEHKSDTTSACYSGVSCYSSKDLYNWHYEGLALSVSQDTTADLCAGCILERPKVIYNDSTELYVMYFHLELRGQDYRAARVGVAVSNRVTGPYTFLHSCRPNAGHLPLNLPPTPTNLEPVEHYTGWSSQWKDAVERGLFCYRDQLGGQMSRDMTLFVDDDGSAYHIYASEENLTLHIARLSDDYLFYTGQYVRVAPGGHNEAPAIFKRNGKYFMITSGCTGWEPNAARLLVADSMMGRWTAYPNPCVGQTADKTFFSQSTYILPMEGKKDAFIFMADRWKPSCHTEGTYVWLPIQFNSQGFPYLEWKESWKLSDFD